MKSPSHKKSKANLYFQLTFSFGVAVLKGGGVGWGEPYHFSGDDMEISAIIILRGLEVFRFLGKICVVFL